MDTKKKQATGYRFLRTLIASALFWTGAAAGRADDGLAEWRSGVALEGMETVEGRAKAARETKEALWEVLKETTGAERVQTGRPRQAGTNEWGGTYDLPFETEDGIEQHLGVALLETGARTEYWTMEGRTAQPGATHDDAERLVFDWLGGTFTAETGVFSPRRRLSDDACRIVAGFGEDGLPSPFDEYWFFFVDDDVTANWGHPARCVFVKGDLSETAVRYLSVPAEVVEGGEPVHMLRLERDDGTGAIREWNAPALPPATRAASPKAAFSALTDGDPSHCYCLLVSGGGDKPNNHERYWNDVCFAYNVMRQRYRIPRKNIKVLWGNGNPASDLCWQNNGKCGNGCYAYKKIYPTANLSDFDQDGTADINGKATLAGVKAALNEYKTTLKSTDQLFIFVTDHGGTYGAKSVHEPATLVMWGGGNGSAGNMTDVQFADLTKDIQCPVVAALETCYSGGMVEEFCDSAPYRVIMTADGYDTSRAGNLSMNAWVYYFFSALCGYYPGGTYSAPVDAPTAVDVRSLGARCNADSDGDGRVSFHEAAQFAIRKNPIWNDAPERHANRANLDKKLFLTKYADVELTVAKEKVATPVLSPSAGSVGYAPGTVKATCGTAGATIRYTLDGSEPTEKSAVYSGGITLTADKTVKARAFKSWMEGSDTAAGKFTILKEAPKAATIMSVSRGDSTGGIVVNWSVGKGTETLDVLRGTSTGMAGQTVVASNLAAGVTSFIDTTAVPGKTYYYKIRANNKYGARLSGASLAARRKLSPPSGVRSEVTPGAMTSTIRLSWKAAAGATHYRVWRQTEEGTRTEITSGWKSALELTDQITMGGAYYRTIRYFLQAATTADGLYPSDLGEEHVARIDASVADKAISFNRPQGKPGSLIYEMGHAVVALFGNDPDSYMAPMKIQIAPGETTTVRCEIVNGLFSDREVTYSLTDPFKSSIVSGSGNISLGISNNGYDLSITGRSSTRTAPAVVRSVVSSSTAKKSRDLHVYVTTDKVLSRLDLDDMPRTLVSGETIPLQCTGVYLNGGETNLMLRNPDTVAWSLIEGTGAELDDGELVVHQIKGKTSLKLMASVATDYGPVTATKTFTLLPSLPERTVEVPALGGQSAAAYVTCLPSTTEFRFPQGGWLGGIQLYYSRENDISTAVTLNITSNATGRKTLGLVDHHIWLSFSSERNPGAQREQYFSFRWEGGGVDFRTVQKAAPFAKDPKVSGGANGVVTAGATTDGSVLHYALDGEEPSKSSPVMDGALSFDDNTVVAVKAYGTWLQASGTAYADVTGKMSKWDEVKVRFVPGKSGVGAPATRTYKVNETFGKLPSFGKTGGQYFMGWSLNEGSERTVGEDESVPGKDSALYGVWSEVNEPPPDWTALPWNFRGWMTAMMVVSNSDTHALMGPDECSIGIVDSEGACRGGSENGFGDVASELHGKNKMHVFGVYGNVASGSETGLAIRVWVKGKGPAFVENPSFAFSAGGTTGSETAPRVVRIARRTFAVTLDRQGGTGGTARTNATFGAMMPAVTVPTRPGYVFGGYFGGRNGRGTQYCAPDGSGLRAWDIGSNATLYAHWTKSESQTVWRFYAEAYKGHFFTISESEKANLIASSKTWAFQGGAYRAFKTRVPGTVPLYRFYSEKYKGHFFTRSEAEKDSLVETSMTWKYQGTAFFVYPNAVEGSVPVYRFWSDAYGHHFYTANEAEKDTLVATSQTWKYQGIAFWAEPLNAATLTFDATGGTCGTGTKTYMSGKAYGELPGASRDGHAFLGWFTEAAGGTCVTPRSTVPTTQTRTLYAHWVTAEEPLTVWRFYSEKNKGHFFTIGEAEKTQLLTTSLTWSFQGGAYRAYKTQVAGTVPLYRFYSEKYKGHFFTRSEAEKNSLVATSKTWKYQGIAFYVYPNAVGGSIPVYRFWSDSYGHHFYTANEAEKNNLVATSKTWKYQGIAFWALPMDYKPGPRTLTVHDKDKPNWAVPVAGYYCDAYQKCEMVYPAAELAAMNGTTITGLTFYASQTNMAWGGKCRVFLKEVSGQTISAFSGPGTVVYEGVLRIANNKMVVSFITPYAYKGGNLLVGVYRTGKGSGGTSSKWVGEQVTGASIAGYNSSSLAAVTPTQRDFLPKTTFAYVVGPAKAAAKAGAVRQGPQEDIEDTERAGTAGHGEEDGHLSTARPETEVTTSDGTDGSAAVDGDEGTAWTPTHPATGSWLVLTFAGPLDVAEVTVVGENLPEDTRVLLSEDAETWFEGEGGTAQYVWVAFPPVAGELKVREVRVAEQRE